MRLLGGFEVSLDDAQIDEHRWRCQSAQAIVAYLVLNGSTHRERLMDLFWPDHPYAHARANLCSIIRYARSAFKEAAVQGLGVSIVYERGAYSFDPIVRWNADALLFRATVDRARDATAHEEKLALYRDALDRYRGELLPGFYYDWVAGPREELRQTHLEACEELAEAYVETSDHREAIAVCRRVLREEPTWESAHRISMRSYAALGRRDQVVRQYRRLCEALKTELSVQPAEESQQLYVELTVSAA